VVVLQAEERTLGGGIQSDVGFQYHFLYSQHHCALSHLGSQLVLQESYLLWLGVEVVVAGIPQCLVHHHDNWLFALISATAPVHL